MIDKRTTSIEKVKRRLFETHGDTIVMVESTYRGTSNKAVFTHKEFGKWETNVLYVLNGGNHPQKNFSNNTIPLSQIKEKLLKIHGDTISIVDSTYKGFSKKAIFNHKIHGLWESRVQNILEGGTHKKAKYDNIKLSIDEIKKRIFNLHGDTVTIVENTYMSTRSYSTFIDKDYGSWKANVNNVINGGGHRKRNFGGPIPKLTESQVQGRLDRIHNNMIKIVWSTFLGVNHRATFIHSTFGEFVSPAFNVLRGCGPKGLRTLKAAKSSNDSTIKTHWKTGEEIVCKASYEPKVVDYLNANKIDYLWQPKTFNTSILTPKGNKSTYRPDLFLVESNKWIEIKGYFRKDALDKWNWFISVYPNSELWDQKKLKSLGIL